jgi:hypothetical protein
MRAHCTTNSDFVQSFLILLATALQLSHDRQRTGWGLMLRTPVRTLRRQDRDQNSQSGVGIKELKLAMIHCLYWFSHRLYLLAYQTMPHWVTWVPAIRIPSLWISVAITITNHEDAFTNGLGGYSWDLFQAALRGRSPKGAYYVMEP